MWFSLAIAAAFGWAIGSIFLKRSYQFFSPSQVYLLNSVSFLSLWLVYNWIRRVPFVFPDQKLFLFLPALPALAFVIFTNALKKGRVSVISAIVSVSPLISTFLALLFLHERISAVQLILIIAIVIAVILIRLSDKHQDKTNKEIAGEKTWGLLSALAFAIANTISKSIIIKLKANNFSLINANWMIIISLISLILEKQSPLEKQLLTKEGIKLILGSFIYSFGGFFLFLALASGPVSLVIPLTNLSVPLTLVFATIFLKEKTTKIQKISILTIFLATTILKMVS